MFLLLALVVLLSGPVGVWSTGTMEETFVKMRVPTGYFQPLEEVSVTRATSAMCVFLCVANPSCKGFVFAGTQCTLGTLDLSVGPYVATYIPEGLDIMVQSDKVNFGALKVPHIGHLYVDTEGQDAAMNATIPAAPIPRVPDNATHDKRFGVLNYKEDIISCGGVVGATYEKKCWRWSFRSGAWSVMHGELNHLHFHGGLVQVAGKLWMIMGSSVHNTPVAVKKVETYDLRAPWRGWKEEPDADVEFAVTQFNAVVFDDAKILLICGRRSYSDGTTGNTYVLDTISGSYTQKGNIYAGVGGLRFAGCAIKPSDTNTILCVGGRLPTHTTKYVREYDIAAGDWREVDNAKDNLPSGDNCSAFVLLGELYLVTQDNGVYRYDAAGSPDDAWAQVNLADDVIYKTSEMNFGYVLKYHQLIE